MPFHKLFILFATFITLCGLTHVFGIFVLWKPYYGIEGLLMLLTGIVSATTAILVWRILPKALMLPSPSELAEMNERLSRSYEDIEKEVSERTAELAAANQELIIARQKADEASQAKTDFLANMSHEIRTPLNVVSGLSRILAESGPLTVDQEKYITTLRNSTDALTSLIDDLLDITRIEANRYDLNPMIFNFYDLMLEAFSIMEVRAREKGLAMRLEINSSELQGKNYIGDMKRIRQIIFNLCANAIKFTQKGEVVISFGKNDPAGTQPEGIWFKVQDTGIGIETDKHEIIFEKFVQADSSINRKYGGSGLGLAISKMFVEKMGGNITVESVSGSGAAFTVCLPLEESSVESPASLAEGRQNNKNISGTARSASQSSNKILLVEDYEPNALVASVFLEQEGYGCDVASNGLEALEKFKTGSYALILMDIQMPLKNGWEATEEIRAYEAANDRVPVAIIGMTAHAYAADQEKCLQVGMNDYITKPYNADDLTRKIKALLTA